MSERLTIAIEDARYFSQHGVMPQENVVGNEFSVTVKVVVPFDIKIADDDISDTISYADIYEIIDSEMQIQSKLIEHVAYRILNSIKDRWSEVENISVKIEKLAPPIAKFDGKASVFLEFAKK